MSEFGITGLGLSAGSIMGASDVDASPAGLADATAIFEGVTADAESITSAYANYHMGGEATAGNSGRLTSDTTGVSLRASADKRDDIGTSRA